MTMTKGAVMRDLDRQAEEDAQQAINTNRLLNQAFDHLFGEIHGKRQPRKIAGQAKPAHESPQVENYAFGLDKSDQEKD